MRKRHVVLIALLTGCALAQSIACGGEWGRPVLHARVQTACADYCTQRDLCDTAPDADCNLRCDATFAQCQPTEQRIAVEDLEYCAAESCDEIANCSVGAGLDCRFDL